MRINSIELKNFRGFESYEAKFSSNVNVFVGENGTGKSALLDALAVGLGSFFLGVDGVSARGIDPSDAHIPFGTAIDVPYYPVRLAFEGEVFGLPCSWARERRGVRRNTTSAEASMLSVCVEEKLKRLRAGMEETLPVIAYQGTGRLWVQKRTRAAARSRAARSRLSAYDNCLEAASDEKSFLDWFKAVEWQTFQEKQEPAALRVVRNTLQSLVPGCQRLSYEASDGELIATFSGGQHLPTRLLSDGFRTMLGLVCDLAWRCAVLNPHLGERAAAETPGVVLVDEIDLHLHPNWQRRVVDDLRRCFPRVQFFLTTHSPFVVQSLRAGEVIALSGPSHLEIPPFKKGIEEVSEEVLGVEDVARGERFREMQQAATTFFELLQRAEGHSSQELERAQVRYLEMVAKYADDPAFLATLKVEGALRGIRLGGVKGDPTP